MSESSAHRDSASITMSESAARWGIGALPLQSTYGRWIMRRILLRGLTFQEINAQTGITTNLLILVTTGQGQNTLAASGDWNYLARLLADDQCDPALISDVLAIARGLPDAPDATEVEEALIDVNAPLKVYTSNIEMLDTQAFVHVHELITAPDTMIDLSHDHLPSLDMSACSMSNYNQIPKKGSYVSHSINAQLESVSIKLLTLGQLDTDRHTACDPLKLHALIGLPIAEFNDQMGSFQGILLRLKRLIQIGPGAIVLWVLTVLQRVFAKTIFPLWKAIQRYEPLSTLRVIHQRIATAGSLANVAAISAILFLLFSQTGVWLALPTSLGSSPIHIPPRYSTKNEPSTILLTTPTPIALTLEENTPPITLPEAGRGINQAHPSIIVQTATAQVAPTVHQQEAAIKQPAYPATHEVPNSNSTVSTAQSGAATEALPPTAVVLTPSATIMVSPTMPQAAATPEFTVSPVLPQPNASDLTNPVQPTPTIALSETSSTSTATAVPPTATTVTPTATAVPQTATTVTPTTAVAIASTATLIPSNTPTVIVPPTPTAIPPTMTAVSQTPTAVPPTMTDVPPTLTAIPPTSTEIPPTATAMSPTPTAEPSTGTVIMVPTATLMPSSTPTVIMPTTATAPPATATPRTCPGYAQAIVSTHGVHSKRASLCQPNGEVASIGTTKNAALILDMGANTPIIDNPGGDLWFYEDAHDDGIDLDAISIEVAPDDGQGHPGPWRSVFVWGDSDLNNNGTLAGFPEQANLHIPAGSLHNTTGIGIDIGNNDSTAYRFVRISPYPVTTRPDERKRAQVDAIEAANFPWPPTTSETPTVTPTITPSATVSATVSATPSVEAISEPYPSP